MSSLFEFIKNIWHIISPGNGGFIDQRLLLEELRRKEMLTVDYNHICWYCNYRYKEQPSSKLRHNEIEVTLCKNCISAKKMDLEEVKSSRRATNKVDKASGLQQIERSYL